MATRRRKFTLPAMRYVQGSIPFYASALTTTNMNKFEVEMQYFEPRRKTGWQRKHFAQSEARIDQITNYMALACDPDIPHEGEDACYPLMPQPVLLNYPTELGEVQWKPQQKHPIFGEISLSGDPILSNFDGGHRQDGWRRGVVEELLDNHDLPIIILNVPRKFERVLFTVVNACQKNVDSDLLLALRVAIKKDLPDEMFRRLPSKVTQNSSWLTEAVQIAEWLNKGNGIFDGNPWKGRMMLPNTGGQRPPTKQYWFKLGKFAEYNRPSATNGDGLLPDAVRDRAAMLCNLWLALKEMVPIAFGDKAHTHSKLTTAHVAVEPIGRLVSPLVIHQYFEGKVPETETFNQLVDMMTTNGFVPRVLEPSEFIEGLKACKIFNAKHWSAKEGIAVGNCRHYHGKGNVSVLVNELSARLGVATKRAA